MSSVLVKRPKSVVREHRSGTLQRATSRPIDYKYRSRKAAKMYDGESVIESRDHARGRSRHRTFHIGVALGRFGHAFSGPVTEKRSRKRDEN